MAKVHSLMDALNRLIGAGFISKVEVIDLDPLRKVVHVRATIPLEPADECGNSVEPERRICAQVFLRENGVVARKS